ncbi:MutS-related protein [Shivajiella indica]|uniref:DNA mismatch repair protein n=1 Tax=Shivajiella indica TaxID=872115 RepID=A0ABW5BDR6_9BACT
MKIPENIKNISLGLKNAKRKAFIISVNRLILFFVIISLLIVGLTDQKSILLLLFPLGYTFIWLIIRFNYYTDLQSFLIELERMDEVKQKRAARELNELDPGLDFLDKKHPFCNDLDLFGPHSLFQLINHTVSVSGRQLLADNIKSQINQQSAIENFHATEELRKKEKFLRNFEAIGRAFIKGEKNKAFFYQWLDRNEKWSKVYYIFLALGPLVGMILLLAGAFGFIHTSWIGLWILAGLLFLSIVYKDLHNAALVWPNEGDIKTFRIWSDLLENEFFVSHKLKELHRPFQNGKLSKGLKSLEQVSFMIQNRFNLVYLIFNLLFWLDFFLLWRLKKWKKEFSNDLSHIEGIFDHWQVMVSLASFSNEEELKGDVIWEKDTIIEAKNLHHPLIPPLKSIGNDFILEKNQKTVLLTGSNMSGKTTFMRTVGINMVLVNLGLRPFAEIFQCGPFQLYTSMRNSDSLGESVSSFYAELARIRQILEAAESGIQVFYLMDEILKGTNTIDRVMGSEALIKQLSQTKSKGIISTHDIELSQLEKDLPFLVNSSFHSKIEDREISFDYKLKSGPCPSFNAHKLMELMGIRFQ